MDGTEKLTTTTGHTGIFLLFYSNVICIQSVRQTSLVMSPCSHNHKCYGPSDIIITDVDCINKNWQSNLLAK